MLGKSKLGVATPVSQAGDREWASPRDNRRGVKHVVLAMLLNVLPAASQTRPSFEVASIRENRECKGRPAAAPVYSQDRIQLSCVSARLLVERAMGNDPAGTKPPLRVEGMPGWLATTYYDVAAKAATPAPVEQLSGPMLWTLLEERFHFKAHLESPESPVYFLTAPKPGSALKPDDRPCLSVSESLSNGVSLLGPPPANLCGNGQGWRTPTGLALTMTQATMQEFADRLLSRLTDRPVIDQTGLKGRYSFEVEYSPVSTSAPVNNGTASEGPVAPASTRLFRSS